MDSPFEYRNCPNCNRDDFDVLFDSNMKASDLQEGIGTVYMLLGSKYGRHVRCRNCHLVYVNPIERASKINEDYSEMESAVASIIRKSRLRAAKSQVQLIKRYKSGTKLLDIGCGEGFFLFSASAAGYTTKGIELSRDAAAYARNEFGLDVDAVHFEESQLPENHFDVVTLWQVLEHVPYPLTILREAHRILKPGGLVAVSTPNIGGAPAKILGRRWWNIRRIHINLFTEATLRGILENAGLKRISSASYWECISLSMLIIPVLKYIGIYKRLKAVFYPDCILGKVMDKIRFVYPSRFDNCIMVGFK
jgi:2-polyprenyl-3-methyl-5-hydroxy-6-metoxy-1,4-benzoquinol methylase